MVVDYQGSKLSSYGFKFHNWAGAGEEAAEQFGLSHAVIVPANSDRVIIGGQVGLKDDDTVSPNLQEEVQEAFKHVELALQAAGLGKDSWEHVYKLTIYLVPTEGLEEAFGQTIGQFLKNTRPATVVVNVASLMHPSVHIEITAEAFKPKP